MMPNNYPWSWLFGVLLWRLWKRRNDEIFGNNIHNQNLISESFAIYHSFMQALDIQTNEQVKHKNGITYNTTWQPPPEGVIKINTNASLDEKSCQPFC